MVAVFFFNGGRALDRGQKYGGDRGYILFGVLLSLTMGTWSCGGRGRDQEMVQAQLRGDTALVYESGNAERSEARLPDGTSVKMHAGTAVRISKTFSERDREVWLEGEAMFDVRADAGKPFIIHTRFLDILVSGTRFRVDARPKEAGEEVDLMSGSLKVMKNYHSDTDNEPELLRAGEMVMINRDIDLMEKEKMDGSELKGWK